MNSSGRTDKHRHILDDALGLDRDQLALLAVMMLRGPQSVGELKTRTERYPTSQGTGFESIDDIEAVLARLAEGADPFVANIGRASGQSQDRWAHLLGDVSARRTRCARRSAGPCGSARRPRPIAGTARGGLGGAARGAGIRTRRVRGAVVARRTPASRTEAIPSCSGRIALSRLPYPRTPDEFVSAHRGVRPER